MRFYVVSDDRSFQLNGGLHQLYLSQTAALEAAEPDEDYIHVVTVTTHNVITNPALGPEL